MQLLLIGNGRWGQNYLRTGRDLDLHIEIAGRHNWQDLVASRKFAGAIIATPPQNHVEIAHFCLQQDIPVLIEKPICLSYTELDQLTKFTLPILVNYIHLFSPYYQFIKQNLDPSKIISIVTRGCGPGPIRNYSSLYDYGCHDLAMIFDLIPEEPHIIQAQSLPGVNGGELFEIKLHFNKIQTESVVGNGSDCKERLLQVFYQNQNVIYNDQSVNKIEGLAAPSFSSPPLAETLKIFVKALEGKTDARLGLELSFRIMRCLDTCQTLVK